MQPARPVTRSRGSALLRKRLPALAGRGWQRLIHLLEVLNKERKLGRRAELPLARRLGLVRRGFLSEAGLLYGQTDATMLKDYVSDWARMERTAEIDAPWLPILNDKLCFWGFMRNFTTHVAPVLGMVRHGRLLHLGSARTEPVAVGLAALGTRTVVKPCIGSGGTGIIVHEWRDGAHWVGGERLTDRQLEARLAGEIWLVCAHIEQAAYARAVFPAVTSTIRMLTLYDDDAGEAFMAAAVHKFAHQGTGPVDNWEKGGISAPIEIASGRLGPGVNFFPEGRRRSHARHPDTGVQIEGLVVPGWAEVRDGMVELASKLPFLPYIGWDVVVTDDGYAIIEGNNRPGVGVLQAHGPLLSDPRVRRFYERHHVV
jgi:hypothetical protein